MSLPGPRFTYADYRLMPEDKRYEVIEGDLLVTPSPNVRHQTIHARLFSRLVTHVDTEGLGQVLSAPTDVILSEENIVQPDILYVAKERQGILDPAAGVNGTPDLVIEILSPSTAGRDQIAKRKLYGKYGAREYWLVDPEARSIAVLTQSPAGLDTWQVFHTGVNLASLVLPGFSIPLAEVYK